MGLGFAPTFNCQIPLVLMTMNDFRTSLVACSFTFELCSIVICCDCNLSFVVVKFVTTFLLQSLGSLSPGTITRRHSFHSHLESPFTRNVVNKPISPNILRKKSGQASTRIPVSVGWVTLSFERTAS